MKRRLLIFLSALLPVTMPAGRAAIVYSGVQDIAIPQNFNGVYLNIVIQRHHLSHQKLIQSMHMLKVIVSFHEKYGASRYVHIHVLIRRPIRNNLSSY